MFQRSLRETARQIGPKTVAISMAEPLQYLLMTVKVVALQKVSFSDRQNPKTACLHIESQ